MSSTHEPMETNGEVNPSYGKIAPNLVD